MPMNTKQGSLVLALLLMLTAPSFAGTKTFTFGWEDGTSTVLGLDPFISGATVTASFDGTTFTTNDGLGDLLDITPSSVTSGSVLDYEAGAGQTTYNVTPPEGSRMLEVVYDQIEEDLAGLFRSNAADLYLAFVENVDNGDIIEFSFKGFDPSDGRSPSILPAARWGESFFLEPLPVTSTPFRGFFTSFQEFDNYPVASPGFIDTPLLENLGSGVFSSMVTVNNDDDTRDTVILAADAFRQSLSNEGAGGTGVSNFYIDELVVTVTSSNPDALVILPDGSINYVNDPLSGVVGDFNNDGFVDVADYTIWRDNLNDPTGDALLNRSPAQVGNSVTLVDYLDWVDGFGDGTPPGALVAAPEPASVLLTLISLGAFAGASRLRS